MNRQLMNGPSGSQEISLMNMKRGEIWLVNLVQGIDTLRFVPKSIIIPSYFKIQYLGDCFEY